MRPLAGLGREGCGEVIQEALEDVRVDSVENQREALAGARADGADDIGAEVITQIRHARTAAARAPSSSRPRIAFHAAFVAIPQFDGGILLERVQIFEECGALLVVLPLGPALRHAQVVVEFVQVADGRTIAQLDGQLLLDPAVDFHSGPVFLRRFLRFFEHRHEQIAQPLQLDAARPPGPRPTAERIDAALVEHQNPQPHHAFAAAKKLGDLRPRVALQQRADRREAPVAALVGRSFHRHQKLGFGGVLGVGLNTIGAQ